MKCFNRCINIVMIFLVFTSLNSIAQSVPSFSRFDFPWGGYDFKLADFNNDEILDIVVNFDSSHVYLGNGNGTFYTYSSFDVINSTKILTEDFNMDGNQDVFIRGSIYLGDGNGGFGNSISHDIGEYETITGDFNNDHIPDIVTGSVQKQLKTYLGNGDGTFREPSMDDTLYLV